MNSDNKHIDRTRVISQEDITRYLQGEMTGKEEHVLEKMALEDPFLEDALEGLKNVTSDNVTKFNNQLLRDKTALPKNKNSWLAWAALASVGAVTLGLCFFIDKVRNENVAFETEAAIEEIKEPVADEKISSTYEWEESPVMGNSIPDSFSSSISGKLSESDNNAIEPAEGIVLAKDFSLTQTDSIIGFSYSAIASDDDAGVIEDEELMAVPSQDYLNISFAYLPARKEFELIVSFDRQTIVQEEQEYEVKNKKREQAPAEQEVDDKYDGFYYNQQPDHELDTLYDELLKNGTTTYQEKEEAFTYIQSQDWDKALVLYKKIELKGGVDNEVLFYRSVAYLHKSHPDLAIKDFTYLLNDNQQTKKEAIWWYLALAYLQKDEELKADVLLKKITMSPTSVYRKLALELLE